MLNVYEIYRSIQGESSHAGRKCVFVRLAGCNLDCVYCDSVPAAKGSGTPMEVERIIEKVGRLGCGLVEITGGEPLLEPEAGRLLSSLLDAGFETLVETNGSVDIGRFDRRAAYIVDVKTPGSGWAASFNENNLRALTPRDEVKFVITSREDFTWAEDWALSRNLTALCPVLLSPATGLVDAKALAEWLLASRLEARLNLQMHKIIWGPNATGV